MVCNNKCWVTCSNGTLGFMCFLGMCIIGNFVRADPRTSEAGSNCSYIPHSDYMTFDTSYVDVMAFLSRQNDLRGFGTHSEGNTSDSVYGLFQCMDDLSPIDCSLCFSQARMLLPAQCVTFTGGRIYLDGCFLRYENYSFYNQIMDSGDSKVCDRKKSSQPQRFLESAQKLISNITSEAAEKEGFSVGSTEGPSTKIYGLAQCWKTLSKSLCKECLLNASAAILSCSPSLEGRALNAGCYMRYATHPFSPNQTSQAAPSTLLGNKHSKLPIILGTIAAAVVVLMGLGLLWIKKVICRFNHKPIHQNEARYTFPFDFNSKLNFDYETLQIATGNFDSANKLGQGGFGSVYQGVLPNGREFAVKKLFFSRGQDVGEFLNEVNLISRVQHKNLVKLLGCSVKEPERLLVYEYLANKSLDRFLFDHSSMDKVLDWPKRFDIILGTARGLAYLHEESPIRIIHRDIKASNILLDQNLKPKIADFGLARYFASDRSHISTGIAGTLGYMAPEYVVRGQLTEKADVYSFGVVVLEIVSGRRNNDFIPGHGVQTLLEVIWNHHESDTVSEILDTKIQENCHKEEALRVLHIALLCTQASAALRPSMSNVIQMLINLEQKLPQPRQPPFIELDASSDTLSHQDAYSSAPITPVSLNEVTITVSGPR